MDENYRKLIEENEKEIESIKTSYEKKLAEAMAKSKELDKNNINERAKIIPHFFNINPDPMLTGSLKYLIEFGKNKNSLLIGSSDKCDIQINGLSVLDRHAILKFEKDNYYLEPLENARIIQNGRQMEEKFQINSFDRLVFGASLYYLFIDPIKFSEDSEALQSQGWVGAYGPDRRTTGRPRVSPRRRLDLLKNESEEP